LTDQLFL